MKYRIKFLPGIILLLSLACTKTGIQKVSIVETTDVHGVILPYDFIEKRELKSSLASTATYLKQLRKGKNHVILLDNGDNLQGQPAVYYYNFIDTASLHINAAAMNFLGYHAATVGNHDIEAGHAVYDRLVKAYDFPLLAANAVNIKSGEPYFKPYTIIRKNGIKIAVFGLITPAVPDWLPPELYAGMEFRDMLETAEKWMPVIKAENPDIIVGLFHSGWDISQNRMRDGYETETSGSSSVAINVPGFDIIFTGHDHRIANEIIINNVGDSVLILNGGSRSENLAQADILICGKEPGGRLRKSVTGRIIDVDLCRPDPSFMKRFSEHKKTVKEYVDKEIATLSDNVTSRDAYFGSSAFVDMIHSVQHEITGADISFAAPLSFDVSISKGPVTVGDMFKLYRFENMLYTVWMTGHEIIKYLEFSYSQWLNTMNSPDDLLLRVRTDKNNKPELTNGRAWLRNQAYNFDSAAGIDYTVDVSKPAGSRIVISSLSNGNAFDPDARYKVAVNSYRGNGGGGHFEEGAGIGKEELKSRIIASTDKDLRYYILKDMESKKEINPVVYNNWKIIPEEWMRTAVPRDYKFLFGSTDY